MQNEPHRANVGGPAGGYDPFLLLQQMAELANDVQKLTQQIEKLNETKVSRKELYATLFGVIMTAAFILALLYIWIAEARAGS